MSSRSHAGDQRAILIALLWIAGSACSGCGSSQPTETETEEGPGSRSASPMVLVEVDYDDRFTTAMRFMPDDCTAIGSVDLAAILSSEAFEQLGRDTPMFQKALSDTRRKMGIAVEGMSRATFGMRRVGGHERMVAVIESTDPIDRGELFAAMEKVGGGKWHPQTIGEVDFFVNDSPGSSALHFPDDRTLVKALPEDLRAALDRGAVARMPEQLAAAWQRLNPSRAIVAAIVVPDERSRKPETLPQNVSTFSLVDQLPEGVASAAMQAHFGADLTARVDLLCGDEETAVGISELADLLLDTAKEEASKQPDTGETLGQILGAVDVTVDGKTFTATIALPLDLLRKFSEMKPPSSVSPTE